jgi:mycothiol synthase
MLATFNPALSDKTLKLRPATPADRAEIARVINAFSESALGTSQALIDDQGNLRRTRYVPADCNQVVVTTADQQTVAYAYCTSEEPPVVHEVGYAVHPLLQDQGVDAALLHWAEGQAQAASATAPAGFQVVVQSHRFEWDEVARTRLVLAGYLPVREWIHLEINLDQPPPSPVWPAGVTVRLLDPKTDWPQAGAALAEAFADHWGHIRDPAEEGTATLDPAADEPPTDDEATEVEPFDDPYFNSSGLCFVAESDGAIIGSCLCNARTVEWPDTGKVGSLSIRRPYRRRGVARALLYHAFGEFYRRGVQHIVTDTDGASFTGANHLYVQVGMSVFRREITYEKVLRMGEELRILNSGELVGL